jgi:predicted transglutaminase-like cysteine proteinase
MKLLEAAGVDREDMYLVIVDDLVRRADHALLVVRSGDQMLVLDNGTDQILEAGSVTDYRPVFSYSAQGTWLHGYAQA